MKERGNLDKKEFLFLHDSLLKKFIEENGGYEPPNVRQKYGFGILSDEGANAFPSLKKAIESNDRVKAYLNGLPFQYEIETRYSLYQNYITLKKDQSARPGKVKIADILLRAFFHYLDFDHFQEFKDALNAGHPPVPYRVLFYSIDYKVEEFSLKIDYAATPYWVEMVGFHRDAGLPVFRGTGIKKGTALYINLECETRIGEEFHIIARVENYSEPSQIEVLPASFMGVSTRVIPTAGECILVKNLVPTTLNDDDAIRKLTALLMLKRNRFTIKGSEIRNLNDLWANGNLVSDLIMIAGNYAVYGYDLKNRWYRSWLEINPETFECYYYTHFFKNYPNLNPLRCELTISNVIGKKLCITTKGKENKGRDIVSFVMVEFNGLVGQSDTEAVFITMSRRTNGSVAGHVVLIKEDKRLDPKQITEEERDKLVKKHPSMRTLYERFLLQTNETGLNHTAI